MPECHGSGSGRPRLDLADVFRAHGTAYRRAHSLTAEQVRAMRAIESCRTATLGGHLDVCDTCGFERPSFNSCRNRHCPKCQSLVQQRWINQMTSRLLPTHYFHVVFTLPAELRSLAHHNRRPLFDLLFQAASHTLLEMGRDPRRLGAQVGLTAVLHTWSRRLGFHPHLHTIVTGGGLTPAGEWVPARGKGRFLFPIKALSRLFRGKFMAGLVAARRSGALHFQGSCASLAGDDVFDRLKDRLYRRDWVVYAKHPLGGPAQVYSYLGRYTHRVAISNSRLQTIDATGVRFMTRDGKSLWLEAHEFIRRFLLHVLPKGFVKIRHYGLLASSNLATRLEAARQALAVSPLAVEPAQLADLHQCLRALADVDLIRCPRCPSGTMLRQPWPVPRPAPLLARSPPPPA